MLKKRDQDKAKKTILCIIAIVGAVAAIAGIAYVVYRFLSPDYLDDFEEDLDDELNRVKTIKILTYRLYKVKQKAENTKANASTFSAKNFSGL